MKKDCKNCIHQEGLFCQSWECQFEPRDYEEFVCVECKYLRMDYNRGGWEVFSCENEDGRGTSDAWETACNAFRMTDEARKAYFERLNTKNG